MANYDRLPPGAAPLAAGLETIAALISVSPNHYTKLVESGVMPQGRLACGRVLWDVQEVREAFLAIPRRGVAAPGSGWDDVV